MSEYSEYRRGYIDGLKAFAHWKDGVEMVGTSSERPLKQVVENLGDVWNYTPPQPDESDATRNDAEGESQA